MHWRKLRRSRVTVAGVVLVPLATLACSDPTAGVDCPSIPSYAIHATARNASTGADITAGAYLVITEGSYKDSVSASGGQLRAGENRAGTYTVKVGHPGFFSFSRPNVVARRDECNVVPVTVQASLNPAPGDPN